MYGLYKVFRASFPPVLVKQSDNRELLEAAATVNNSGVSSFTYYVSKA